MTKRTMTETAALKALLSETPDHQVLAEMPGFVADRPMALDVDQLRGAGAHERSTDRGNQRNGYRERRWGEGMTATGPNECPNAPVPSVFRFPSCGKGRISRSFWNRAAPWKRQ